MIYLPEIIYLSVDDPLGSPALEERSYKYDYSYVRKDLYDAQINKCALLAVIIAQLEKE